MHAATKTDVFTTLCAEVELASVIFQQQSVLIQIGASRGLSWR
jgi:hypothetical protein